VLVARSEGTWVAFLTQTPVEGDLNALTNSPQGYGEFTAHEKGTRPCDRNGSLAPHEQVWVVAARRRNESRLRRPYERCSEHGTSDEQAATDDWSSTVCSIRSRVQKLQREALQHSFTP
jgi:hypothetical protein